MPPALRPPQEGTAAKTAARSLGQVGERKVSMGPSGISILLVIAGAALGAWLYLKPPSEIGPQALPRYIGFEANLETVILRNCTPTGCAAVYLTPTIGRASLAALPEALRVAGELEKQGVELFIVFGGEAVNDAVKRVRGLRRPIVFDPTGEWARESGIEAPCWIAWRTGGKIRLKSRKAVSAADLAAAIR
jgi:hypothetical protein